MTGKTHGKSNRGGNIRGDQLDRNRDAEHVVRRAENGLKKEEKKCFRCSARKLKEGKRIRSNAAGNELKAAKNEKKI